MVRKRIRATHKKKQFYSQNSDLRILSNVRILRTLRILFFSCVPLILFCNTVPKNAINKSIMLLCSTECMSRHLIYCIVTRSEQRNRLTTMANTLYDYNKQVTIHSIDYTESQDDVYSCLNRAYIRLFTIMLHEYVCSIQHPSGLATLDFGWSETRQLYNIII